MEKLKLIAYLSTLAGIVIMTVFAALVCLEFSGTAEDLAKLIAALGFIGASVTGLIGVLGSLRPSPVTQNVNEGGTGTVNGTSAS